MKPCRPTIFCLVLILLCSCAMFDAGQSAPTSVEHYPETLVLPVGKNWQVKEEAPHLSDERGRLPFQTEQTLQPEGAKSGTTADDLKIETPR